LIAALLALASCSAPGEAPTEEPETTAPGTAEASPATFPRTVHVPAGTELPPAEVDIPAEPQRVAALTYETAALVAELGAADRLVMVPAEAANPVLSNAPEEMEAI